MESASFSINLFVVLIFSNLSTDSDKNQPKDKKPEGSAASAQSNAESAPST